MTTVAIIGAGPSGLAATKAALECGLEPRVFEKATGPGGLWRSEGGAAWPGMHTNLSKYTCCFSDFPWPETALEFPSQEDMQTYLADYADRFDLLSSIQFNSPVIAVTRQKDMWCVKTQNGAENHNGVVVASGIFARPYIPDIPGLEHFRGSVLHSSVYRTPKIFNRLRVLVVGNAFSGAEIASELTEKASVVVNTVRMPYWVLPRYHTLNENKKIPIDLTLTRADRAHTQENLSSQVEKNHKMEKWYGNPGDFHPALYVDPDREQTYPRLVSDTYLERIAAGKLQIHPSGIEHFDGKTVVFDDGTRQDFDAVIFGTGYAPDLAFLPRDVLHAIKYDPDDRFQPMILFKATLHPDFPNLFFPGLYRGPYFSVMELQGRWAAMLLSGGVSLPSMEILEKGLADELAIRNEYPRPQFPHEDHVGLADSIAREIGVMPNLSSSAPYYQEIWEGPVVPAHYRLEGPGAHPDLAIQEIQSAYHRVL